MTERDRSPRGRRRRVLRRSWNGFLRHRGYDSAAALTFFTALTVLPATLLTVSSFSLLSDRGSAVRTLGAVLGTFIPDGEQRAVQDTLRDLLQVNVPAVAFVVGLGLTIWTLSGYTTAFGRAVNAVYEVQEGRMYWRFRGAMLLASVPLVALGAVATSILLVTPSVARRLAGDAGIGGAVVAVWNVAKWPLLVAVLLAILTVLFRVAPNVRLTSFRLLSAGTLLSLGAWAILTLAFAAYVTLTGTYGNLYGRLGLLLVALLWAYLSNLALMIGAQLDAEIVRLDQLERGEDAVESILLPVKSTHRQLVLARRRHDDLEQATRIRDEARARRREGPS
ncbi:MAG: YihY/virulence factor BrkB family protein [Micrococcales bacterium]|nr:YihY/virulence factor BrkB family protein [Micrococcales bacterium]